MNDAAPRTYAPQPHVSANWQFTKPAANGRRGIVVSQARAAAEAGVAVLEAGGNAIDAAVATAFALTSQEPWNSGIGGIGFCVIHRAGQKSAEVVDFGPVAPRHLSPANFKLTGRMSSEGFKWPEVEGDTNIHGPLSVAVPSSVAGYHKLHSSWGKLPIAEVMAPAVALAKRGLPQDWVSTLKVAGSAAVLRKYAESARIYLRDGLPPTPPAEGEPGFYVQGNLPNTLERLQHAGLRDYYEGDIAAAFVRDQKAVGGIIDAEDLRACQARVVPAIEVPWRGTGRVLQLATGLTAGPTLRDVLSGMKDARYGDMPDAAWYRKLAAELRAAYHTRLNSLGAEEAPEPKGAETCTTHLTVCDAEGTMVSLTTTLMSSFGSRVVLPETGILLNNGVMWFDPRPGQPNSIAPGKRPLTNMCPMILKENDAPILAVGASGGRRIMASVFQMMTFVADFGMDPEQAAHHPRIDVSSPDAITADRRLGSETIAALSADAPTEVVTAGVQPINFACPNMILQRPDGSRTGISDWASPWSLALAQ
ncbi:MAG: gamma-glutamyltransferase [Acetobacteraceae bacterium]|nr:gamma-glutamyltransferase [Acetobacteraceae bacterium]